jgi:hypothetical protein
MQLRPSIPYALGIFFGSICLFVTIVAGVIGVPGVPPNRFWDFTLPLLGLVATLLTASCLAWRWHRRTGKSLVVTLFFNFLAVLVGAVVISMITMRGNWLEIMKETLVWRLRRV